MKFVDINLFCNKLIIQLLANDSIINTKKRHIFQIKDKINEFFKAKITKKKRIFVK